MCKCDGMYKQCIPFNTDNQGAVFLEEHTTPKILPFYDLLRFLENEIEYLVDHSIFIDRFLKVIKVPNEIHGLDSWCALSIRVQR